MSRLGFFVLPVTLCALSVAAHGQAPTPTSIAGSPADRAALLAAIQQQIDSDIIRNPQPAIAALPALIEQAGNDRDFPLREIVRARGALAYAHAYAGDLKTGLSQLEALTAELSGARHVDVELLREARRRQAVVLGAVGRSEEAFAIHEANLAAEEADGRPGSVLAAGSLSAMGIIRAKQGRYPDGLALMRRSVAAFRANPEATPLEVGDAWRTLVVLLELEGLNSEAIEQAQLSVAFIGSRISQESETYTGALVNLGAQLTDAGRLSEAEQILRRHVEIEDRLTAGKGQTLAIGLANLASVLVLQNNSAGAEPLLRTARDIFAAEKRLQRPDHLGITTHSLALAVLAQGRPDEAKTLMEEALAELEAKVGKDHPSYANVQSSIARLLLDENDIVGADHVLSAAMETVSERLDSEHPSRLTIELLAGEARTRLGDPAGYAAARAAIHRDRSRVLSATVDPLKSGLLAQERSQNFTRFARLALEHGEENDAFEALQLAQLSDLDSAGAEWIARQQAASPEVAALIREVQDGARTIKRAQASRSSALASGDGAAATRADEAIDKAIADAVPRRERLARELPAYATIVRPEPVPIEKVRASLGAGKAFLIAVPEQSGVTAMMIDAAGSAHGFSRIGSAELQSLVTRVRAGIDEALRADPGQATFDADAAFQLYNVLFPATLERRLAKVTSLSFQTGGVLSSVPMAALITRRPAQHALQGPALRDAPWLLKRVALARPVVLSSMIEPKPPRRATRVFAIGAPDLNGSAAPRAPSLALSPTTRGSVDTAATVANLRPLPRSAQEIGAIAAALDPAGALVLRGAAATEESLLDADLEPYGVIVFATHGLVSGELRGLTEPALVLTPGAREQDGIGDGLLTASEISRLKLNADWVILSACNTAAGEGGAAPIFSGLARAFVHAGADSLLLSQWQLDDSAAAALTVDTVQRVAAGAERADALRGAQLALLHDASHPELAHPAFWGGFVLLGN